jgi:3-oxoacyl-[acyl-carrier protein] reductase|tara:strand:- start:497 stop:1273 length:777 start_codon:yes stop_codon:yes gene_type:complete
MDLSIKNKNALVTGGSRGLGLASAISLAKEGVNIIICARSKDDLDKAKKLIQNFDVKIFCIETDLSDQKSIKNIHKISNDTLGNIDILVNNVGGSLGTKSLETSSINDFQKVMDINTWVAVNLTKLFLTDMVSKKWGRIINIASIYGREFGGSAPYMAAKSALIAITKHTAIDLAKTGVTANCIAPGSIIHNKGSWEKFVENNSQETVNDFIKSNLPMGKFGYPEAVGDTVAFLASKNASMILGTCINVDGGQSNSLI